MVKGEGKPISLPALNERMLAALWSAQGGDLLRGPYWTVDNRAVAVVYRGRWDGGPGPDFRDGMIELEGRRLLKGDVELHLHAADWQRHGHHRDLAYNNVVLHVTLFSPRPDEAATVRADGTAIPTLALQPYLALPLSQLPAATAPLLANIPTLSEEPCWQAARDLPSATLAGIFDAMGGLRFAEKAAGFEAALAGYDPYHYPSHLTAADHAAQVLYAAICDALGYSQNRQPMQQLAAALPLHQLVVIAGKGAQANLLEAALLGVAGLLPSQRKPKPLDWQGAEYSSDLERQWQAALSLLQPFTSQPATASPYPWQFAKVRPANHPVRRLAAAAALLSRYLRAGLLDGLHGIVAHADARDLPAALIAALTLSAPASYWADHADFGSRLGSSQDLIGESRAAEIALNVVLPFLHAYANLRDEPQIANKTRTAYHLFPRLAGNETTRRMAAELLGPRKSERGLLATARRQQGLIHLYRHHCGQQACAGCPVGLAIRAAGLPQDGGGLASWQIKC